MIFRSQLGDVTIPDVPYPRLVLGRAAERADRPVLVDGPSGRTLTQGQVAAGVRREPEAHAQLAAREQLRRHARARRREPLLPARHLRELVPRPSAVAGRLDVAVVEVALEIVPLALLKQFAVDLN